MTILHYTGARWDGGGIHAVIRQLASARIRARMILGATQGFKQTGTPCLPVWRGPEVEAETIDLPNLWRTLQVAAGLHRWLRRGPQRVFHGHSRAGLLVALWLWLFGQRRVVATVHAYGRQRWFYRFASAVLGRQLVWLTPAMKKHYGVADATWAGCMPNGLTNAPVAEMRRWPGGRPLRLGGAGMLVGWKRWDLVLKALAHVQADRAVEFRHIGGAVDTAESRACAVALRERTEDPRIAGRVSWLGWQDSSSALLTEVDAVVVPSDGEPFSMIALEAWFAGVPVIATRGGGPEDFIVDGENGWLVPRGDADALAAQFERCLDPATWRGLRMDAARLRQFSLDETLAPRWEEVYASVCRP